MTDETINGDLTADETINGDLTADETISGDLTASSSAESVLRRVELPARPALPGHFGSFEVLGEIARGAQGKVLRARRVEDGTLVALKLLLRATPASLKRFRQEGQTLARLRHPSVVQVVDQGEHEGVPYLAMELVEGRDLDAIVEEERPDPAWAARTLQKVAEALEHCHQHGVVHRDLKPANIVIERESGRPVIVDFGLVKRDPQKMALSLDEGTRFSHSGELRGTPAYMAPEQAGTERFGPIGPHTDVYALGATLFHLLAGRPPFVGESFFAVVTQVGEAAPPDPREVNPAVPRGLARLCRRALAKSASSRPASAEEFARALGAFVRAAPPRAEAYRRWGLALCLLPVVVGFGLLLRSGPAPEAGPPPPPPADSPPQAETPPPAASPTSSPAPAAEAWSPAAEAGVFLARAEEHLRARTYDRALSDASAALRLVRTPQVLAVHAEARYRASNDRLGALRDLEEALGLAPEHPYALALRGYVRLDGVEILTASPEDVAAARADAEQALRAGPQPLAHLVLTVGQGRDLLHQAVRHASKAAALAPYLPEAHRVLGRLRILAGNNHRALSDFDRALALDPRDPSSLTNKAAILVERRDYETARRLLEQALEVDPRHAQAWLYRGRLDLTARPKNLRRAIEAFDEAIACDPGFGDAYFFRAAAYHDSQRFEDAIESLERAEALRSRGAARGQVVLCDIYLVRGHCHYRRLQWEDAAQAYAEYLRLAPVRAPAVGKVRKRLQECRDKLKTGD